MAIFWHWDALLRLVAVERMTIERLTMAGGDCGRGSAMGRRISWNIARTCRAFQTTELVEYEQRVIADAGVRPFQTLIFCSPSVGLTMPLGERRPCTRSIH